MLRIRVMGMVRVRGMVSGTVSVRVRGEVSDWPHLKAAQTAFHGSRYTPVGGSWT